MSSKKVANQTREWETEGAQEITSGGFWQPTKVGESIRGVLLRFRHNQGQFKQTVADIRTEDAVIMSVGLTAVLEARLTPDMRGKEIGIMYTGKETSASSGQTYKMYRVMVFASTQPNTEDLPF